MWLDSSTVYDEWFKQYYFRYDKFITGIERELL